VNNSDSNNHEQYERYPALYVHMQISFIVELKRKENVKYLKCVKGGCDGCAVISRDMYVCPTATRLKSVLHVTWAGAIRLTFIPVAAPASENWWAESRCIRRTASVGVRTYIEVWDLCPQLKAF